MNRVAKCTHRKYKHLFFGDPGLIWFSTEARKMLEVRVMFLKEDSRENMHTNYYNKGQLAKMIRMIRIKTEHILV